MRIVCISDTHCQLDRVDIPEGDVLLHSGDLTYRGSVVETSKELYQLSKHRNKFKSIILCEGNHDWLGEKAPTVMDQLCKDNGITLLRDSGVTIDGINFYGSPFQPEFCNWSFNLPRGKPLADKWDMIPENTNVLLTHGPAHGLLDSVERWNGMTSEMDYESVGCEELLKRIGKLPELKLHVFGHIHSGYGKMKWGNTQIVNASICTEEYKPTNKPLVIEI